MAEKSVSVRKHNIPRSTFQLRCANASKSRHPRGWCAPALAVGIARRQADGERGQTQRERAAPHTKRCNTLASEREEAEEEGRRRRKKKSHYIH